MWYRCNKSEQSWSTFVTFYLDFNLRLIRLPLPPPSPQKSWGSRITSGWKGKIMIVWSLRKGSGLKTTRARVQLFWEDRGSMEWRKYWQSWIPERKKNERKREGEGRGQGRDKISLSAHNHRTPVYYKQLHLW